MHASRGTAAGVALALAIVAGTSASAHRRDEYLQAARIDVAPDHVAIDLDLTPGAAVAEAVIAGLDGDRDGVLSANEQQAYARHVVDAVSIAIDGRPLPLRLTAATFPALSAARRGEGIIRVRLDAQGAVSSAGAHQVYFKNAHLPEHSVYLANALVPESARVSVTAQRRNIDQSELTIDYAVAPAPKGASHAPLIVTLTFASMLMIPLVRRMPRPAKLWGASPAADPASRRRLET